MLLFTDDLRMQAKKSFEGIKGIRMLNILQKNRFHTFDKYLSAFSIKLPNLLFWRK